MRAIIAPKLHGTLWIAILPAISSTGIPAATSPNSQSTKAEMSVPTAQAAKASSTSSANVSVRSKPPKRERPTRMTKLTNRKLSRRIGWIATPRNHISIVISNGKPKIVAPAVARARLIA